MNINRTNDKEHSSPCEAVSKYFKQSKCVMDISSDFQDKKCNVKGPKTTQKLVSKSKVRKTTNRIKGQKDIRTALKSKKNELLTYTKEFDKVCKQSGVDVDSEQLQLAVALSKSLQKTGNLEDCVAPNPSLNSQDRTGNIRTTLQEYGFTVPEIKITKTKKFKKIKRDYKLLLLSKQEKQQTISDKYAQVLFQNVCKLKLTKNPFDYSDRELYYKATSIPYREIKTNDLLFVNNLIKKSTSTGSLLRSWGDIPGRPMSPTNCEMLKMNFSEIECSQDELDIVLSGSLKSAKDVVKNKVKIMSVSAPINIADDNVEKHDDIQRFTGHKNLFKNCDSAFVNINNDKNFAVENKNYRNLSSDSSIIDKQSLTVRKITRSCSPDIFDDEVSTILDTSEENKNKVYSELINSIIEDNKSNCIHASQKNVTNRKSDDMMEITECVVFSVAPENEQIYRNPKLSQNSLTNAKISKYDDFVEITDPIEPTYKTLPEMNFSKYSKVYSQPGYSSNNTKRISNDFMEITECVANTTKCKYVPVSIETNINLTHDEKEVTVLDENLSTKEVPNISHTSSGDEFPIFHMDRSSNKSLEDTIILNDDEINNVVYHTPMHVLKMHQKIISVTKESSTTESLNKTAVEDKESGAVNVNQCFFDEFVHNHSDDTIGSNTALLSYATNNEKEIDLTQSSDEAIEIISTSIDLPVEVDKCTRGKREDVSIDYDDLYDEALQRSYDTHTNINNLSQQSNVSNAKINNLALSKASSDTSNQNSGVLEFSDQEFNYSINKSRHEVPWVNFGDVSVLNDSSKVSCRISEGVIEKISSESNSTVRPSMSDSFLPIVEIKGKVTVNATSKEIVATPKNDLAKKTAMDIGTPSNSDYIIKTNPVTPMLDYETMSTPDRNRELDRYGLKPFKKKRAVQLLTHLYNQTHPVVQLPQEMPLPSKKRKHSQPSPMKSLEPGKQNANNIVQCDKEKNLYELTKELPDITAIECLEEDWVFQKREKAKIPSCRLPLHIAFHNYVSCRRWLREAILRYEPVNIDDIHKGLVAIGCRYDPKDLLKFMDKKCITVKTADNNARNKR